MVSIFKLPYKFIQR